VQSMIDKQKKMRRG